MRSMKTIALSMFVWLAVGSVAFADVRLSFHDGQVSIVAKDATIGQILAEWAKIGQTKIVNGERIPGALLTIELENVSEQRALDVVLREWTGYVAAPRASAVPNASRFDRIIVVPAGIVRTASSAPPAAKAGGSSPYQTPAYPQQESAYQAPGSPQQPSASQAPAYAQQQVAFVPPLPADDTANDVGEEPLSATVGGAISTRDLRVAGTSTARQALETIDPRKMRLEMPPQQGSLPMVPPSGGMLRGGGGGVAIPGMIARPTPQPR
jgi:hypothetical protein